MPLLTQVCTVKVYNLHARRCGRPSPKWKVYVDMYLNLPYPYWYKEYCLLNAPEQVQKYEDTLQELYDIIGAPCC